MKMIVLFFVQFSFLLSTCLSQQNFALSYNSLGSGDAKPLDPISQEYDMDPELRPMHISWQSENPDPLKYSSDKNQTAFGSILGALVGGASGFLLGVAVGQSGGFDVSKPLKTGIVIGSIGAIGGVILGSKIQKSIQEKKRKNQEQRPEYSTMF